MSDVQLMTSQLFQQGRVARINGAYEEAITLMKQCIAEEPNFAEAHMELGLDYCFSGLFEESIQELELATGLDAQNPEIRLNLGKMYTMLCMYEEGAAAFQAVLALAQVGDKCYDEAAKQLAYFQQLL